MFFDVFITLGYQIRVTAYSNLTTVPPKLHLAKYAIYNRRQHISRLGSARLTALITGIFKRVIGITLGLYEQSELILPLKCIQCCD